MINEKYTIKMMEIKKVGYYVDRLASIESDMCQDVDEGSLDKYVLTLVENCIDRINRVYIEGEKRYNSGYDCCEHSDNYDYVTAINKDEHIPSINESVFKAHNDCDEFGKVSDVVTQGDESNDKEVI